MSSEFATTLACVAVLLMSASLDVNLRGQAQPGETIDPALLAGFKWRSIGPDRGGRSIAVAGVKGRPREAYFGATGGGLWKTTDGGARWAPVTDGQIKSSSVGAVAVSESIPDIVFIGMGESCIRGNIMPGDGVYKSTDAGKTWTHVGFSDSDAISKIRIHPTNPDIVFVAAFGRYGTHSDERGVFKSTDGGKTWKKVLFRNAKTGAVDVAIDRRNPNVMFAALWEAYRIEYQMSSGGPGSGLFKSTDGGETWREITRNPGLPQGVVGKIGVDVSGADSNRVYALVENENGGLFSSDDAGATWKMVNDNRSIRQRAFYYTHVYADPSNKDTVYALNTSAFRSTDGGKTLTQHRRRHARRSSRSLDRSGRRAAPRDRQRRRRRDHLQRRVAAAQLVRAGVPDRAVLPRDHDEARAVSRLRLAAGQQHAVHAEQQRPAGPRRRRRRRRRPRHRSRSIRSAAASRATSRPIRRTSTSSTPARTTARS